MKNFLNAYSFIVFLGILGASFQAMGASYSSEELSSSEPSSPHAVSSSQAQQASLKEQPSRSKKKNPQTAQSALDQERSLLQFKNLISLKTQRPREIAEELTQRPCEDEFMERYRDTLSNISLFREELEAYQNETRQLFSTKEIIDLKTLIAKEENWIKVNTAQAKRIQEHKKLQEMHLDRPQAQASSDQDLKERKRELNREASVRYRSRQLAEDPEGTRLKSALNQSKSQQKKEAKEIENIRDKLQNPFLTDLDREQLESSLEKTQKRQSDRARRIAEQSQTLEDIARKKAGSFALQANLAPLPFWGEVRAKQSEKAPAVEQPSAPLPEKRKARQQDPAEDSESDSESDEELKPSLPAPQSLTDDSSVQGAEEEQIKKKTEDLKPDLESQKLQASLDQVRKEKKRTIGKASFMKYRSRQLAEDPKGYRLKRALTQNNSQQKKETKEIENIRDKLQNPFLTDLDREQLESSLEKAQKRQSDRAKKIEEQTQTLENMARKKAGSFALQANLAPLPFLREVRAEKPQEAPAVEQPSAPLPEKRKARQQDPAEDSESDSESDEGRLFICSPIMPEESAD